MLEQGDIVITPIGYYGECTRDLNEGDKAMSVRIVSQEGFVGIQNFPWEDLILAYKAYENN